MRKFKFFQRSSNKPFQEDYAVVLAEFDHEYYKTQFAESQDVPDDLLDHYLDKGWQQGLNPCAWFNTKSYLSANNDVFQAGINPFVHYLKHGYKENRLPCPQSVADLIAEYKSLFSSAGYSIKRKSNQIVIEDHNLLIKGKSDNTIWTAADVLCKQEYFFQIDHDYLMIDNGCNLAMTALLFANQPKIMKIYGYEPFLPTFNLAKNNMKLNPKLAKKIKLFNFGLGAKNEEKSIHYNSDLPGAMSTINDSFTESNQIERVKIKNVSDELKSVIKSNSGLKIFVKLDAEGAEYEIIDDLDKSGMLRKIDVIIAEWHQGKQNTLIDILTRNGMFVFCSQSLPNKQGIIRAVRF